jgi:hypothetical protein
VHSGKVRCSSERLARSACGDADMRAFVLSAFFSTRTPAAQPESSQAGAKRQGGWQFIRTYVVSLPRVLFFGCRTYMAR